MALEARGNERLSTSGRTHSSDDHSVNEFLERMFAVLQVVPSTLINKLAQDFDRGLGSVLFFKRHVKIVNKNDCLHTETLWSEDTSAALVRFLVNNTLDLI